MSQFTLNNKWSSEVSNRPTFEIDAVPYFDELPETGITLMQMVVENQIGPEIVLVLHDKTPSLAALVGMNPLCLLLKSGLIDTSHGPVLFLFFYIPNPTIPSNPYFSCVQYANPFDQAQMATLKSLASQTHWHVILVDAAQKVRYVTESENASPLGETLSNNAKAITDAQPGDFALATQEFSGKYTLQDLLVMKSSPVSGTKSLSYTLEIVPGKSIGPFCLGMTVEEINDAVYALSSEPITLDDLGMKASFGERCTKLEITVENNKHELLLSGTSVNDIGRDAAWDLLESLGSPVLRSYATYDVPEQGISATRWESSDDEIYCIDVTTPTKPSVEPDSKPEQFGPNA